MNSPAEEIISLSVLPNIKKLTLIMKITQEVAEQCGLDQEKGLKVSLAVEEIFHYCVRMIQGGREPARITLTYRLEQPSLHIEIEYKGPHGVLEKHFLPGNEKSFKLTSFDAVGLRIAAESIDELKYVRFYDGTNRFTITTTIPPGR